MQTKLRRATGERLLALQEFDLHAWRGRGRSAGKRRDALAVLLPAAVRHRYERLRTGAKPPWVYRLANGACPCCHVMLPLQLMQDARAHGEIVVCDHCLRFIIAESPPMGA